jgi:hypothetical protein
VDGRPWIALEACAEAQDEFAIEASEADSEIETEDVSAEAYVRDDEAMEEWDTETEA